MILLDENEAKQVIANYINSREWWMFIDLFDTGHVADIEETFYSGAKNADFQIMLGPQTIGAHFAHKRHLPAGELASFLNERAGALYVSEEDLCNQDIIHILPPLDKVTAEDEGLVRRYMSYLDQWLGEYLVR